MSDKRLLKTREVLEKALGGILFVDEAYAVAGGSQDFGQEAIDTIVKFMDDHRDNIIVILADMKKIWTTYWKQMQGCALDSRI